MAQAVYDYVGLSTRDGFNRSLRHFQIVNEILPDFEGKANLADVLNSLLDEKRIQGSQLAPILNALLVSHPKYHYCSRSYNLTRNVEDFGPIVSATQRWNAVDLILAYYHPDLGLLLINPKNPQHWESVQGLRKNELLTIYCGTLGDRAAQSVYQAALEALIAILDGRKAKITPALAQGKFRYKPPKVPPVRKPRAVARKRPAARRGRAGGAQRAAAARAASPAPAAAVAVAAPPSKKRRMTPMYSIPVSNELFHNGNVEAWKKIIQSYNHKYPGLEVFIFYEGERIHDINTLFKWGKVKHGSTIMIAIAGEDIKDVAKLQRYLRQGASPAFEAFLKFPVNTVLNLF
jgi:hypothetical protein